MGLDQVVTEVRQDGEARAQEIVQNAKKEAESILQAAREKAQAHEKARLADAERDAEQVLRQAQSRAKSEARKVVLQTESALRDRLRGSVLEAFSGLDAKARKEHLASLLERAKAIVPSGRVYGNAKDKATLEASGYAYGGDEDITGGIIVESEDGATRLDLSYETMLDGMWREVLRSEAKLFA